MLPEYGVRSWGHCTVSETMTLAQPPYVEKRDEHEKAQRIHFINAYTRKHMDLKTTITVYTEIEELITTEMCVYLGAQAHSTLQQLTEPGDQLTQHRNIKVLQTLSRRTHKANTYRTDLSSICHILSGRNLVLSYGIYKLGLTR